MYKQRWLELLQNYRAIAIIRSPDFKLGMQLAQAVAQGGIGLIEITWNSDRPADLIALLRQQLPHCTIGAGTLITKEQVQEAIACGAEFLFSPHTHPPLIEQAINAHIPIIPGALTPTEIVTAWQSGASSVKVFPIQAVGGSDYLKSLQGPLGPIPLIATGGVTLESAPDLIKAGAIAIGLSSQLFPPSLVKAKNWPAIAETSRRLLVKLTMDDP
jgi:2-dehydro-3-deoxyphosphogluconate aldolase/(4S)-4-hydroxy-2-oxoglutarate aldolase